jgi:hypothetical protein
VNCNKERQLPSKTFVPPSTYHRIPHHRSLAAEIEIAVSLAFLLL